MSKRVKSIVSLLILILIVALVSILLIASVGSDISEAINGFFKGIFGSAYAISEVFVRATPLILCGLGVTMGFKSGFLNLGAEGQFYFGAIGATSVALLLPDMPAVILIPSMMIVGFLLGGLWAFIPGILKAKYGVSEVLNTLMFNYIAIYLVGILVRTWLKDPDYSYPVSPKITESAHLAKLSATGRIHTGIFIAVALAIIIYIILFHTRFGFDIRAVGLNPNASKVAGIAVNKSIILSSLISGGLAGIAGVCEIAGVHHQLIEGISPGYGYLAIMVALLGNNNPFGVVISAVGIAALQVGSQSMQRSAQIPSSIATIILGLIVLLILIRKFVMDNDKLFCKSEEL